MCIVDNDKEERNRITLDFLDAGYIINSVTSGASSIKRIAMDVPDVAIVKQSLVDIAGDVVILKLQQNENTKDIKCVLFDTKSGSDIKVADAISKKSGVYAFVGESNSQDILNAVDEVSLQAIV